MVPKSYDAITAEERMVLKACHKINSGINRDAVNYQAFDLTAARGISETSTVARGNLVGSTAHPPSPTARQLATLSSGKYRC